MFMDELEREDRKISGLRKHPLHARGEALDVRRRESTDDYVIVVPQRPGDNVTETIRNPTVPRKRRL